MVNFPASVRIRLACQAVDLRRGFDRLAEEVRQQLALDALSGHLFVFRNKRSDRVKLLYWDEDGFVIVYKRLEQGTFHWPSTQLREAGVTLRAAELTMLLDGLETAQGTAMPTLSSTGQRLSPPPRGGTHRLCFFALTETFKVRHAS
jgi:transposase